MNDPRSTGNIETKGTRRFLWPVAIGVYWLMTSLLHLEFSLIIISPIATPLGPFTPANYSTYLAWGLLILGASFVLFECAKGEARLRTLFYWSLWGGAVYLTNRFLVLSPNEYAHYPQYALLAVLLALWRDPGKEKWPVGSLIFWGTALGVVDEVMQYLFVCPSYGDYLDFNDFLLNELGIVAGLLLVYGFKVQKKSLKPLPPIYKTRAFKTVIITFAVLLALILTDRLKMTPPRKVPPGGFLRANGRTTLFVERKPGIMGSWNRLGDGRVHYVLSPAAGLFLLFMLGFLFASFDPRMLKRFHGRMSVSLIRG
jgi:hypothetical protein